jgi:hypothetical protein
MALVGMIAWTAICSGASPVTDPIRELIRAGGVDKGDDVLVATFDWNGDGKDDFLVISGKANSMGGRLGGDWNVWLSNSAGTYDLVGSVMFPAGMIWVARLPESGNTKAVVVYQHFGGGLTGITAYYLTSDEKIETKEIGVIHYGGEEVPEDEALVKRVFGSAEQIETRRIPALQLWPEEGLVGTPPPSG